MKMEAFPCAVGGLSSWSKMSTCKLSIGAYCIPVISSQTTH